MTDPAEPSAPSSTAARNVAALAALLVPLSWLLTPAASSDTRSEAMETLVVTGTRLEGLPAIPGHVTVIDRAMLEARQARSVLDVLRSVGGLQVTQYGGRGGSSSVFIRGGEPNFTVVLIDGVKVNDPTNTRGGSFDFNSINLAEVERIEIVRGSQSSLYGSDALSGIINVITRSSSATQRVSVEAELGADEQRRGAMHVAGPLTRRSDFAVTATAADDGDGIEGNSFDNRTLNLRVASRPMADLQVQFSGRYADSESTAFPEDSGGPQLAVLRTVDQRRQTTRSATGSARWAATPTVTGNAHGGWLEHDDEAVSPGIAPGARNGVPPNRSQTDLQRLTLGANLAINLAANAAAAIGADYQDERGQLRGRLELFPGFELPTDFNLDRDTVGIYGELRLATDNGLSLNASLRRDIPSEASATTTQRLGVQYATDSTRVFANWSEGFKLPSLFALGHGLVGNAELRPETSDSWEIGLNRALLVDRVSLTVVGFRAEYQNLIDFDFELFTNVNRTRVNTEGVEVVASLRPSESLRLDAHLTYVDVDVKNAEATLRQRPDWRGGIAATWQLTPAMAFSGQWLHVGDVFDSSVPTGGRTLNGYQRLDVELSWQPAARVRLWLAGDNLLNERYQEAIGFPGARARWRLGGRYSF